MDTQDQSPAIDKSVTKRKKIQQGEDVMLAADYVEIEEELVEENDKYGLLNKLEKAVNAIIVKGDHHERNFEVKRYINNIRKSGDSKTCKKYLALISRRVPGPLIAIVKSIRDLIILEEESV